MSEPAVCIRHKNQLLSHMNGLRYCPICRDNIMFEKLNNLGLSQEHQSKIMDLIQEYYPQ